MKKRKPLKIAVVVGVFPSVSEAFITNQLRFLVKSGHHVDILATRHLDLDNPLCSSEAYNSLKTKARELSKTSLLSKSYFQRLFKAFSILLKFRSSIHLLKAFNVFKYGSDALNFNVFFKTYYKYYFNIYNYDVVHIHYGDNAVHLDSLINNFKKSIVVTFHGYDAHKFEKSFYNLLSQRKDITITVNTNFTKSKVEKLGFDTFQINILPVGLDTNIFNPEKKDSKFDNINILFVGRLIELKGPILAIKIVEKILEARDNVILNIIGDGPMFSECESYIEINNLTDRIHLLGSKSQSDIKYHMKNSDIFLFPGIVDGQGNSEAQGLVIQEAQAMQLPVVTSNVGGISDGLIDKKTGFIVEESNVDTFVSKIVWLMDNPSIRKEMGEAGRQFVVRNYDSSILGEKLLDIYYDSLKN
ncbi:glycosyltransferase [Winogradskyella jejuensis]|uniref:Colanic acid/amylovoran biosynthesis glycosyltransferase n=1 Tax=Winogradskyella jejuensis TaxID=1089305 RepID=A0A1M5SJJ4_9FLAO|nr:glycosyltransferase [Winogradskyella jejuensis]SHH38625.1 colanic acid/amylovoran biosynthesis glycosyltransferase [Winogradskyella jejuensis]